MHIKTSDQPTFKMGFGRYTCNWGLYIAGLYETEVERDEIIIGFLHQGDLDGDLQLYCPVERSAEDFIQTYGRRYPDCAHHTADANRFRLLSAKELYYPDGVFSPWAMDDGLEAFFVESQRDGKRNIRATAEMVWALEAIPGSTIMNVLRTHPCTISGGIITENPYYQDPDVWLKSHASRFLIRSKPG